MGKQRKLLVISISCICLLITVACSYSALIGEMLEDLPENIVEQIRIFLAIPVELDGASGEFAEPGINGEDGASLTTESHEELTETAPQGDWEIDQCNAISNVSLSVVNYEEDIYAAVSECDFNYLISNNGDDPMRVLYYLHPDQSDELPPSWGWLKGGEIAAGGNWQTTVQDRFRKYVGSPLSASGTGSIAFVYSVPECQWITIGGIQAEISKIADNSLLSFAFPCKEFSFDALTISPADFDHGLNLE